MTKNEAETLQNVLDNLKEYRDNVSPSAEQSSFFCRAVLALEKMVDQAAKDFAEDACVAAIREAQAGNGRERITFYRHIGDGRLEEVDAFEGEELTGAVGPDSELYAESVQWFYCEMLGDERMPDDVYFYREDYEGE